MKHFWIVALALSLTFTACAAKPEQQALSLTATDIKFDQTQFTVTANQPVKLTYTNTGQLTHDFSILKIAVTEVSDEGDHAHSMTGMTETPDLHIAVEAGGVAVLYFTPTVPGTYEFVCTVEGHKEAGMVGQLVVK